MVHVETKCTTERRDFCEKIGKCADTKPLDALA
jgi:hypothetical protein